jgi:hypothetical protein
MSFLALPGYAKTGLEAARETKARFTIHGDIPQSSAENKRLARSCVSDPLPMADNVAYGQRSEFVLSVFIRVHSWRSCLFRKKLFPNEPNS